jgi:hypothetical protein
MLRIYIVEPDDMPNQRELRNADIVIQMEDGGQRDRAHGVAEWSASEAEAKKAAEAFFEGHYAEVPQINWISRWSFSEDSAESNLLVLNEIDFRAP